MLYGAEVKKTAAPLLIQKLSEVDATAITKNKQFKPAVCATAADWRHNLRAEKRSLFGIV